MKILGNILKVVGWIWIVLDAVAIYRLPSENWDGIRRIAATLFSGLITMSVGILLVWLGSFLIKKNNKDKQSF